MARLGRLWNGPARLGMAGLLWRVCDGLGTASIGMAGEASRGRFRSGEARFGESSRGRVRRGKAWQARRGPARFCVLSQVMEW